ncbi:MAG: TolC family protein, partial [Bacteroidota bacterium]
IREDAGALSADIAALTGGQIVIGEEDRLDPPLALDTNGALREGNVAAHPMLEAGRSMRAAEESMAEMSRTRLRPDFTVGVNVNLSQMAFDRMYGQEPVMPTVGLTIPLWRGGVRAEIREAELRARQRELETADTRIFLEADLAAIIDQLERVQTRIDRFENRLRPQVRQTLDATLAGYRSGTVRFLELLDAQRMARDIEIDLVMARVREAELSARLDATTGRIPAVEASTSE